MDAIASHARYGAILPRLQSADPAERQAGAAELVGVVADRLRAMARRMLRGFPTVRRFSETDDVAQGAALRLHRALATVTPADPASFLGLVALQVRRELVDLARKYAGPESPARHFDTDVVAIDGGGEVCRSAEAVDAIAAQEAESFVRWVRFHEVAATLQAEERTVFEMVWYLGASQAEIAELLGCSERTVRRRWEGARDHFQSRFRGEAP
jgi:RNA polymerase sigma factor (sigma-70 family)